MVVFVGFLKTCTLTSRWKFFHKELYLNHKNASLVHPYTSQIYRISWIRATVAALLFGLLTALFFERTLFSHLLVGLFYFGAMFLSYLVLEQMDYGATNQFREIQFPLEEGEMVVKEGKAKLLQGKKALPGKLVLTNRRLMFQSLRQYKPTVKWEIALAHVQKVVPLTSGLFIRAFLHLKVEAQEDTILMVPKVRKWTDLLTQNHLLISES